MENNINKSDGSTPEKSIAEIMAFNAMTGLAAGDAVSWTAMFQRSFLLPPWTRRIRREMDTASEAENVIASPMPFSLNQPGDRFDLAPACNTEWAAFTAEALLQGEASYENTIIDKWKNLASSDAVIRGTVSIQAALRNIRKGIMPPRSGRENPHYFDDSAMVRAVPIGAACAGDPEKAASIAYLDASVTNSEDGIWAAQAAAAAVSMLCAGRSAEETTDHIFRYLPEGSWVRRTSEEALSLAEGSSSVFLIMPELQKKIINPEYSYGNAAPETLAVLLVITKLHGRDFEKALSSAALFAKCAQVLPALAGAFSGAMQGTQHLSGSWLDAVKSLKGISLPSFAGRDYINLSEKIAELSSQEKAK